MVDGILIHGFMGMLDRAIDEYEAELVALHQQVHTDALNGGLVGYGE